MLPNLERYKSDLDSLLARGAALHMAMRRECFPEQFEKLKKRVGNNEGSSRWFRCYRM
jgi:hypothetical protein